MILDELSLERAGQVTTPFSQIEFLELPSGEASMDLLESSLSSALLEFARLEELGLPSDFFFVVAPGKESGVSRYLEYFRLKELGLPYAVQASQGLQIVAGALNAAFRFRRSALLKR